MLPSAISWALNCLVPEVVLTNYLTSVFFQKRFAIRVDRQKLDGRDDASCENALAG